MSNENFKQSESHLILLLCWVVFTWLDGMSEELWYILSSPCQQVSFIFASWIRFKVSWNFRWLGYFSDNVALIRMTRISSCFSAAGARFSWWNTCPVNAEFTEGFTGEHGGSVRKCHQWEWRKWSNRKSNLAYGREGIKRHNGGERQQLFQ